MKKTALAAMAALAAICAIASESPRWMNIAPLDSPDAEAVAQDQRFLVENTIIDSTAFMCTLVPEGEPVFDKAAVYAPLFADMKKRLEGIRCGVLFQATMGHGWMPDSRASYQTIVLADGSSPYVFCPLDERFLDYIRAQAATLAAQRPDFFMIDDDTRLITGREACYCPLHLKEMERRLGREFTRETLAEAVRGDETAAKEFSRLLSDSVAGLVKAVREEFDKVDASIPGSFCCCLWDAQYAARMARILAAEGQTPVVRLNNGRYLGESARDVPAWLHRTAMQLHTIPDDVIVIDEPDTCPHNQYSMSAKDLAAHIALSVLEGCRGGKVWITRLSGDEPASGLAYRRELAGKRGFFEKLLELEPSWDGVKIPFPQHPYAQPYGWWGLKSWDGAALGKFGIPFVCTRRDARISAISGEDVRQLSDGDISFLLSRKAIIDGEGALALARRGFGELIGCDAKPWEGPVASFETIGSGGRINDMVWAVKLEGLDPRAETLSTLWHREAGLSSNAVEIGTGSYRFRNSAGGEVVVLAATLPDYVSIDAFSFYNETRKRQIVEYLALLSGGETDFPHYPGTGEVMVKWGRAKGGERILAAVNLGHDDLDSLGIKFPKGLEPAGIRRLAADGSWENLRFGTGPGGDCVIETKLGFLDPAVFAVDLAYPVAREDLHTRDPYIVVDREEGKYLLFTTYYVEPGTGGDYFGMTGRGVQLYESPDLEHWSEPKPVLEIPGDVDSTAIWAPEVHEYGGKWYVFATVNYSDGKRGTWTFVSDDVRGPYRVMKRKSITPEGWRSLDGTLWVEDGRPYMVFCHEWVDVGDGEVCAVPLSGDLSEAAGEVTTLFRQSDAPDGLDKVRITDGPFLRRKKNGELWMIWSTVLKDGNYSVYKVKSESGTLAGPWKNHELLFGENGGHAMIFEDLEGRLRITLHTLDTWDERAAYILMDEDWNADPGSVADNRRRGGYVFSYFSDRVSGGRAGEAAGLHLAWSYNGLDWFPLNGDRPVLAPEAGAGGLMRDPSIARSDQNVFHMVWSTGWSGREIGHAKSIDLVHWSAQETLDVMGFEPSAKNAWAPEVTFDRDEGCFYVYWASMVSDSPVADVGAMDHRIYAATTWDFSELSPSRLWFDPGFSCIDAAAVKDAKEGDWILFVKNESAQPLCKDIRMVRAKSLKEGFDPANLSGPITPSWTEGPTAFWVGDDLYLFFDRYAEGRYGALKSRDRGRSWEDITDLVSFPPNARHGTVFPVTDSVLKGLFDAYDR